MRLKQLEVHGFKTFANRTDFTFREGITAVVGPNGCGKSNIADAIRWALGEQSPSNLRTKKTEDLIFTGSSTRPRMGMAEVALTLENPFALTEEPTAETAPVAETPAAEEGSETARPRASVVEEILRARPSEVTILRRAYRSGENEYLINRQRVRLRDVQELLQRWGLARLTYAVIGQGLIDQALSLRAEERRLLFEEAAGIGLYQSKKANALEKLDETRQNLVRVNDIINEIAPRLPSLARQADRAGKYEAVSTALNEKLRLYYAFHWSQAQEGFLVARGEEESARENLNARRGAMHDLSEELTQARRAAQVLRGRLSEQRRILGQRENEFAAAERELAVLNERAGFAQTQHTDAQRDLKVAAQVLQAAELALNAPTEPLTVAVPEPEFVLAEPETPEPPLEPDNAAEADAQALDAWDTAQAARVQELEASLHRRAAAIEQQTAHIEENAASADTDWQAAHEQLTRTAESSADELRARSETQAAEQALAHALAEDARARALARQRLAQARVVEFEPPSGEQTDAAPPDLAAHLIALQDSLPMYEFALASVANLAARADDLARRDRAQRERERQLERVRAELNETRSTLALAEKDVAQARAALQAAERERERAERERQRDHERAVKEHERERERRREQFQRERERLAREAQALAREREQFQREQERERTRFVQERQRERERERERLRQDRERARQERERLAAERARERERLERARIQERERLAQEHARAQREHETRTLRLTTFAAQINELDTQRAAALATVTELRAALDALRAESAPDEAALSESEHLQNQLEEREVQLRSDLTVAEELYNRAVLEAERRRAEIARLEQEIEDDLGPVELDSATPRQLRLRLVVRARPGASTEEQDAPPADAGTADAGTEMPAQEIITLPEVDALPDGFDKEIRRLKNQMRYIGNVNPNAPQEYAELRERHAFLTEQAADLTQAIEKLQQATQELDAMMKQKFEDTFASINTEFRKYFTLLFGGGTARLELTDPTDVIHSGIEITARPPGKRAAQLVLLSGGERALTAAALIFSILRVSPTPFCVMDEVDAALDEANVGRFRDALRELAAATQFIVITHNRVTMEGARAIYGVSMGEDGVSQVLSLKLDQAAPVPA